MKVSCTCPMVTKDGHVVRAALDQTCPVHGQRAAPDRASADAKDAERYRWLRAGGPGAGLYVADSGNDWREVKGRALDEAVDAGLELNRAEKSERPTTHNQS